MKVKIINRSGNQLPSYQTELAAGLDLHAHLDAEVELKPLQRALIPTGIHIELPAGYEAQVRPRSGLAARYGITVLNTPGTIDADYRGEVKVILINLSQENFVIQNNDRIAQLIVSKHERIEWEETPEINETPRKQSGFGSTGR
jgi:dUTP pyrophosphatase